MFNKPIESILKFIGSKYFLFAGLTIWALSAGLPPLIDWIQK